MKKLKQLEQTWRWYGPNDPVSLSDIRQAGATGIVSALHHIPNGNTWEIADIKAHQQMIEKEGLTWSVVESLPVTEAIKQQKGPWKLHIENYKTSLRNLGECGIPTVTYNFMPILDWTRTHLDFLLPNGATALRFDQIAFAAFDIFLLERPKATTEYKADTIESAYKYFNKMSSAVKTTLIRTIIAGLPGAEEGYTLAQFREAIAGYEDIEADKLRTHLSYFLQEVVPIAASSGIKMAIHPDDPPFPILGLPRVVSTASDLNFILKTIDDPANGLCFCTGSLGARPDNDLPTMIKTFASKINFLHLRSTTRDAMGNFYEADHLAGDVDMYEVMKLLLAEQQNREHAIPMRPDHGHKMLDDLHKKTNPGYSAIGRLKGLAELRGLEIGVLRSSFS